MPILSQPVLLTDTDGRARWRDEPLTLSQGTELTRLSELSSSDGVQWRFSPVGFQSDFHCTTTPQWLIVLQGCMEIGLQDGSKRQFGPGQYFYSNDTLPAGATFDPTVHGHCSRQVGDEPLLTVFVRSPGMST